MSPGGQTATSAGVPLSCGDDDMQLPGRDAICRDFLRGTCTRPNCRFLHEITRKCLLKETFNFCHDYQNKGCFRINCKFVHCTIDEEEHFYKTGFLPQHVLKGGAICKDFLLLGECRRNDCKFQHNYEHENEEIQPPPPPPQGPLRHSHVRYVPYHTQPNRGQPAQGLPPPSAIPHSPYFRELLEEDAPSEAKFGRYSLHEENKVPTIVSIEHCHNCNNLDRTVSLLHDNMTVLLKKVADLTQKNMQLSTMNEFLLDQTASLRGFTRDASCVMTSSVATGTSAPVSLTTVSVSPVVPALVPAAASSLLTSAAAFSAPTSRSQLLGTTQQLVSGSGALIVTSAGAQQLVAAGSPGLVAMTAPAQIAIAQPASQLLSGATQQLVQQSANQLVQQSGPQLAQQLAQQSGQVVERVAVHLAAQQSAQQQLVHQTTAQQLVCSTSQALALSNAQAQPIISYPIMTQSILPH